MKTKHFLFFRLFTVLLFLATIMFTGCKNDDDDDTDTDTEEVTARFTSKVDADNYLKYTFTNESLNATTYSWDFGDKSEKSTDENPTYTFSEVGSYKVVLTASDGTNEDTREETITIQDPEVAASLLTGKWKLARTDYSLHSFGVGKDRTSYERWWNSTVEIASERPCLFAIEFDFKDNNKFDINTGEEVWLDTEHAADGEGCYTKADASTNKDEKDITAWHGGTFDYEYDIEAKELKVSGKGSFLGLPKVSGTGKETATEPQEETTYSVKELVDGGTNPDTLVVLYYYGEGEETGAWELTLVKYKSDDQEPELGTPDPTSSFSFAKDAMDYKKYTFTNTSKFAESYSWEFGSDGASTDKEPTHTFSADGSYVVKLSVTGNGKTVESMQTINVTSATGTPDATQDLDPAGDDFIITFETDPGFEAFGDGAAVESADNPKIESPNESEKVGKVSNTGINGWEGIVLADLSNKFDFSTNTGFKVKVYSPAVGALIKLKLEDNANGNINIEVDATTTVKDAWEELTFHLGDGESGKYDKVVLFFGFESVDPKVTLLGAQTFYFDDFEQTPTTGSTTLGPTDSPTAPSQAESGVTSLYSDAYTDIASNLNPGWNEVSVEETHAGNAVRKTTNFQPFQLGAATDISGHTHMHVDVWLPELPSAGAGLLIKILGSAPQESTYTELMANLTAGQWNSIDIPLSSFAGAANLTIVDQVLVDIVDDATMFIDNVYFYGTGGETGGETATEPTDAPTAPSQSESGVTSLYSDAYTDIASNLNPSWNEVSVEETHAGNAVRKTTNFQPFQLGAATDISGHTHMHVDVWLPELPSAGAGLLIKILNAPDNEINYTFPIASLTVGQWVSIDAPLSSFSVVKGTSNTALTLTNQVLIEMVDNATMFVDNVYFY